MTNRNQVGANYIAREREFDDWTLDIAFGLKPDYTGKVINRKAAAKAA